MLFWMFLDTRMDHGPQLPTSYNYLLVAGSVLVAMLASYAALEVVGRVAGAARRGARQAWLIAGAIAMGAGVWAMHFVGMLAFSLPVPVNYDLTITLVSVAPAIFASYMALRYMSRSRIGFWSVNLAGLFMAGGIGGMHYTGMAAMRMGCMMGYIPSIFVLSIVVAHVLATIALATRFYLPKNILGGEFSGKVVGAVIMGIAVSGMHYTGMAAARYYPSTAEPPPAMFISPLWMAVAILTVVSTILGLAIVGALVDRHLSLISYTLSETRSRARRIIEASPEAFISVDERGSIQDWNRQAEFTFGWKRSEVAGKPLHEVLMPERHWQSHLDGMAHFLTTGEGPILDRRIELDALHRDGHEFPVEAVITAIRFDAHYLFFAFLHDISERKKFERELREATEAAQAASKAKGEFLANMSHEIRTPMNGVLGMTELLTNTQLSKEQREYADHLSRSGESLLTIINDILDFSKIEAGRIDLEFVDFDPRHVVEDVAQLYSPVADERGVELIAHIHPEVPPCIAGDPGRLRQVLNNLVGNAVKFTERGEVVIAVRAELLDGGTAGLTFEVRDTGIGIPPERLEHVFDAFTQADASTTRRFGGTGLGLTISRQLVELMGGALKVESEVGKGTTFSFRARFEVRERLPESINSDGSALRGHRALIVDDNSTNRMVLREQLRHFGLESIEARSGEEALALLEEERAADRRVDICILDYHMEGMDGLTLGERIHGQPDFHEIPLVMLTSVGAQEEVRRAATIGFAAYLVKPVRQSYLLDCLVSVIETRSSEAAQQAAMITTQMIKEQRIQERGTLLLAEDNTVNQHVARSMLRKLGYTCDVVTNGKEAVEAVRQREYRLVFMDCQMPEMDGYEATAAIRALEGPAARIPIVAMTANAMKGDKERCLEAGMDSYIAKPISLDVLSALLKQMLGESGATDAT